MKNNAIVPTTENLGKIQPILREFRLVLSCCFSQALSPLTLNYIGSNVKLLIDIVLISTGRRFINKLLIWTFDLRVTSILEMD